MKDPKYAHFLPQLAMGLSAVAARLDPREAAQVAQALTAAMKDPKNASAFYWLAQGLSVVAARLDARAAAQAAQALTAALKDPKNATGLILWAQGLSSVAARLDARDAAQAASLLLELASKTNPDRAAILRLLAGGSTPAQRHAAQAVALVGCEHPLMRLAALAPKEQPWLWRLSDQQLVDLLKLPTCVPEARRLVLDVLADRHRRPFRDHFDFVRFAGESSPGLDFLSPPARPEIAGRR